MRPELIAILVTALLQSVMLVAAIVMMWRLGKLVDVSGRRIKDII
jgi:hypothetical protein